MEDEQEEAKFRSFIWVREQNKVELADQVNVVSIGNEEDTQNFEFPCP